MWKGLGVFFNARTKKIHQTPCIYLLNSFGDRQTSDFHLTHLLEKAILKKGFISEILYNLYKKNLTTILPKRIKHYKKI